MDWLPWNISHFTKASTTFWPPKPMPMWRPPIGCFTTAVSSYTPTSICPTPNRVRAALLGLFLKKFCSVPREDHFFVTDTTTKLPCFSKDLSTERFDLLLDLSSWMRCHHNAQVETDRAMLFYLDIQGKGRSWLRPSPKLGYRMQTSKRSPLFWLSHLCQAG